VSELVAHEADLRILDVTTQDAAPEPVAAWLRVAARRLSGSLVFTNQTLMGRDDDAYADGEGRSAFDERPRRRGAAARDDDDAQGRCAFELPCLDRATSVSLDLGRLGLIMTRAGAFVRLTEFSLINAQLPAAARARSATPSPPDGARACRGSRSSTPGGWRTSPSAPIPSGTWS